MMISKNRISEIRKLHSKKFREELGIFIVEGVKSVKMLLGSDFDVVEVFTTPESRSANSAWLEMLDNVTEISPSDMDRISTMQTSPEILAIVKQRITLPEIPDNQPVLALDHISDPGNLGTILRTADWFGIHHVVCSMDCVELYNPKTIQATMGSFINVNVRKLNLPEFLKRAAEKRRIIGTFMDGKSVPDFGFQTSDIVVIGNEANGISKDVAEIVTEKVTIPRFKEGKTNAESLNAAIAASILMYSWRIK